MDDIFSCDFSVDEFLLLQEIGFAPLEMVVGTSIYHIGLQQTRWNSNQEMIVLSDAIYDARKHAMKRMVKQAEAVNADGIVGVRLNVGYLEWNKDLAVFSAIGTAIKDPVVDWRVNGKPFTSDLSGQEFWMLMRSGYRPLGLVMGNCVYHVARQSAAQAIKTSGRNSEMPNFTEALYDARELCMERMQLDAKKLGATGIVGVKIEEGSHSWDEHIIDFFAVGTAIAPSQEAHHLDVPQAVISLNDSPQVSYEMIDGKL